MNINKVIWQCLIIIFEFFIFITCSEIQINQHYTTSLKVWAEEALNWLNEELCSSCGLPSSSNDYRLYAALPTNLGKLRPIAADASTRHAGIHDSILILDPKPNLRFGHPVFMFFIDLNITKVQCENINGRYLKNQTCLQGWRRGRCHRRVPSRRIGCQLVYLPEVRLAIDDQIKSDKLSLPKNKDLLECIVIPGFYQTCPRRRKEPTTLGMCNPLATNSKSCDTTSYLRTHCHFMQTCDHGVLISGGWNRQLSDEQYLHNIINMNKLLLNNGFLENNIRIFFADGLDQKEKEKFGSVGDIYPSGLKLALRYHLRTLCEKRLCADSLVIYMNSPTRPDGATLLWDVDSNGEFDETEVYTIRELLRDLENCKARRTILLADQSYGGEIVRQALRRSNHLSNLVIISWTGNKSNSNELIKLLGRIPSTDSTTSTNLACLNELAQSTTDRITFVGLRRSQLNVTLSGASCTSSAEDIRNNRDSGGGGCQNLSTLELLEDNEDLDGS
ncbi:hypothetical protein O3M35_009658 [Rhynocoris fuscipes]|uniref:Uncharacterized protein n=1 Tax=Rhynocoris fuscipes TaxID=488301 RepID=A0AAW1D7D1_9HEMI